MKFTWTWNGEPLNPPLTILRRLIAFPFFFTAKIVLFITVCVGWGLEIAIDKWNDLT